MECRLHVSRGRTSEDLWLDLGKMEKLHVMSCCRALYAVARIVRSYHNIKH